MRTAAAALCVSALLIACDNGTGPNGPSTSFERLEAEILVPRCGSCHTAGTSYAAESGLILDGGEAFANLVGVEPVHPTARADGLLRVAPGNPDQSLLYQKLIGWIAGDTSDWRYGNPMPLGGPAPSVGQVEFVRRWIVAGASAEGDTIDVTLLADPTPLPIASFDALARPARGVQLHLGPFPIQPQFEREIFVYRDVGNAEELFVNRMEVKMRPNSHHFVLYTFQPNTPANMVPALGEIRDLRNPSGALNVLTLLSMQYHVFFGGAMTAFSDHAFPAGVAVRLAPGAALDLNSHYVNNTDEVMFGEVYVNLHTLEPSQVEHVAEALFLNNADIELPPQQRTTLTRDFHFADTTRIALLSSHMHKRGESFVIRVVGGARDGELVYQSTDWESPPIVTFDPALILEPGQGLRSEITWFNETSQTIRFGLLSEDEMGIIFGYRY